MDSSVRLRVCEYCRGRHVKCDDQLPSCKPCQKQGIECRRNTSTRFKHSVNVRSQKRCRTKAGEFSFSATQTWVTPTKRLEFVDESQAVADSENASSNNAESACDDALSASPEADDDSYDQVGVAHPTSPTVPFEASISEQRQTRPSVPAASRIDVDVSSPSVVWSPLTPRSMPSVTQDSTGSTRGHGPPNTASIPYPVQSSPRETGFDDSQDVGQNVRSSDQPRYEHQSPSTAVSLQTLRGDQEAFHVLRKFVGHFAPSFDLFDKYNHFAELIPRLAVTNKQLLETIRAVLEAKIDFAKAPSPVNGPRLFNSLRYQNLSCLSNNYEHVHDDVLATLVLVRALDLFQVAISDSNSQALLTGADLVVNADLRTAFGRAMCMVSLRQEIYLALVTRKPINGTFIKALDSSHISAIEDDSSYASNIVILLARIINFCFDDYQYNFSKYQRLQNNLNKWHDAMPQVFLPIFEEQEENKILPVKWYTNETVVAAIQYFHLSVILLITFNPRVSKLGWECQKEARIKEGEIYHHLMHICGLATSNKACTAHWVTASTAIMLFGEYIESKEAQKIMAEILLVTKTDYKWNVGTTTDDLYNAWRFGNHG